jgi:hypothetical protein
VTTTTAVVNADNGIGSLLDADRIALQNAVVVPIRLRMTVIASTCDVTPAIAYSCDVTLVIASSCDVIPVIASSCYVIPVIASSCVVTPVIASSCDVNPVIASSCDVNPVIASSCDVTPVIAIVGVCATFGVRKLRVEGALRVPIAGFGTLGLKCLTIGSVLVGTHRVGGTFGIKSVRVGIDRIGVGGYGNFWICRFPAAGRRQDVAILRPRSIVCYYFCSVPDP